MKQIKNFFIITNSPGELAGWVAPVVLEIKKVRPEANVEIFLAPCQFKSGREKIFAETLSGVGKVWEIPQTLKFIFKGFPPEVKNQEGVVLFLGGDPYFGQKMAGILGWPLFTYTRTRAKYPGQTRAYFVPSRQIKEKFVKNRIPAEKIWLVGDLAIDAVRVEKSSEEIRKEFEIKAGTKVITFMPSSRPTSFVHLLPVYLETAEYLLKKEPGWQVLVNVSPFIPEDLLLKVLAGGTIEKKSARYWIFRKNQSSVKIIQKAVYEGLAVTDFLVAITGTNTLQAAFLGVPMLVLFPLNKPELIQIEGLWGLLGNWPILGRWLKMLVIQILKKGRFIALPNIIAKKYLVPEMVAKITGRTVSQKVLEILSEPDELKRVSEELKTIAGGQGAAQKLVEKVLELS